MPNTLNDIFAHLDNAKASRAYETNQERRRKVEEALLLTLNMMPMQRLSLLNRKRL